MADVEIFPGTPFCDVETLNRIARQQGLCLAIAQASVYDAICQAVALSTDLENKLVQSYLQDQDIQDQTTLELYLNQKGWSHADLRYFATKAERLDRFQRLVFDPDVEEKFLAQKLDLDHVTYSMIRIKDGNLAFELHQRLVENESSFETLAAQHSEGPERDNGGIYGPVPLNQAHDAVVLKLRTSAPGQLLEPFFLVDTWLILRLEHWQGARLDQETREQLRDELFDQWLNDRVMQLLSGRSPAPLPTHLLKGG